ncbi:hypothetical protein R1sor_017622 [Riccia sorocarpa]|uniref:Fe2OG dioxygenase domain-containing protein n=1 Tax=Riccia sorocarpa TaxID=122646 RepID=A0ABD3I7C8_9MARC
MFRAISRVEGILAFFRPQLGRVTLGTLIMGYVDSQEGSHSRTAFRNAEKQYKRYKEASTRLRSARSRNKIQPTDVSQVLDFSKYVDSVNDRSSQTDGVTLAAECLEGKPVFVIEGRPGFHFIPQALTVEEQHYWIKESLVSFPEPPNRTNHNAEYGPIRNLWSAFRDGSVLVEVNPEEEPSSTLPERENSGSIPAGKSSGTTEIVGSLKDSRTVSISDENVERRGGSEQGKQGRSVEGEGMGSVAYSDASNLIRPSSAAARVTDEQVVESSKRWHFMSSSSGKSISKSVTAESLLRRLRWATIGIQFDWSKKAYNTSLQYKKLPSKLSELAARLAIPATDGSEFKAEAAIVNYYRADDMLGGHVDDMEADWSKPIVSISLGCKAIFLLGGETREEPPVAMFLRSGDVVLMSGPARKCFHGVPRIFVEDDNSDLPDFSTFEKDDAHPVSRYIRESRININIRQVY